MGASLAVAPSTTRSNSIAVDCLVAALDESGQPHKAFAQDLGIGAPDLSRALTGANGARFDIRWLDDLPPYVVLDWLTRYARVKFSAYLRLPEPQDLLERVLAELGGLTNVVRSAQTLAEMRARKQAS